jgi:hypothetical protein
MSARQLLPLSGIAAVLLIIAAFVVGGESPDVNASLQEITSYYTDHESELQIASALLALGAFFFLLFSAAIVSLLREGRDGGGAAATVSLAGGIVFAVGVTVFAGLGFTAGDVVDDVSPDSLQTLHVLGSDMFFTVAVGTAAFLLGTGVGTLRTDALPSWLSWAAIVIGVIAITPIGFAGFLALGIWTLIVSVMLSMRAGTPLPPHSGP